MATVKIHVHSYKFDRIVIVSSKAVIYIYVDKPMARTSQKASTDMHNTLAGPQCLRIVMHEQ